ncbi:hypothetical protein [Bacillus sp. PS06]|uniref:hypothetical protein n=1 Tax=Bacillus sp. PS06 TaxID=2764176 RepID=UPI0017803B17|nr:hypothetical protein [Bacillus sp. PS06]MBD8071100.1 hypothetical protein [Bacillus sp. PS06]
MNKKWVRFTLAFTFLFSIFIVLFNFFIDPLHFYRSNEEKKVYWGEQRWQLAGLAKNYNYNTIILGTSMTENFIPSEVDSIFPEATTLKLSMSGSSTNEQSKIAHLAFSNRDIKNVIWGIDYTSLSKDNSVNEDFPAFLYDENVINDLKYLLNMTTIKYSISSILNYLSPKISQISLSVINLNDQPKQDIDYLNYWGDQHTYNKEIVIADYLQKINEIEANKQELLKQFNIIKFKDNIDENIIPYVKNNPDTQFYFYYPPYSVLMNKRFYIADPKIVEDIIKSREYFYSQIKSYPNVKLYDFTSEKDITYNLDLYKDTMHHNPEVNKFILESFTDSKYLVTDNNIDSFLREFIMQIENFSLEQ